MREEKRWSLVTDSMSPFMCRSYRWPNNVIVIEWSCCQSSRWFCDYCRVSNQCSNRSEQRTDYSRVIGDCLWQQTPDQSTRPTTTAANTNHKSDSPVIGRSVTRVVCLEVHEMSVLWYVGESMTTCRVRNQCSNRLQQRTGRSRVFGDRERRTQEDFKATEDSHCRWSGDR